MLNDGPGNLSLSRRAFNARISGGTLGMAVADLNGDGRLDEHPPVCVPLRVRPALAAMRHC